MSALYFCPMAENTRVHDADSEAHRITLHCVSIEERWLGEGAAWHTATRDCDVSKVRTSLTYMSLLRSSGFFSGLIFINFSIPNEMLVFSSDPLFHFSFSSDVETFRSITTEGLRMVSLGGALLFDLGC